MYIPRFDYSDTPHTFHTMRLDGERTLKVIGDGDMGCYEWIVEPCIGRDMHSNAGYGSVLAALRDGLIAYLGLPNEIPTITSV